MSPGNHATAAQHQIDRDAYEPAYLQLANSLRRQIAAGTFRPGDQLPSEAQLVQRYGVSPMTVRRSINLLADQGVVSTAQGRGTFVRGLELSTAYFDLQDLQALFGAGDEGAIKLLDVRVVSADERTARKLGQPVGLGADSGLPVGMQIMGRAFDESGIFAIARALESALPPLGQPKGV